MDGRGRAFDDIFVERLWRTVKYEDVYLKGYATMGELLIGLSHYFGFYNGERPHQALNDQTPDAVYRSGRDGGALIIDKYPRAEPVSCGSLRSPQDKGLCGEHHDINSRIRAALFSCTSHPMHNLN